MERIAIVVVLCVFIVPASARAGDTEDATTMLAEEVIDSLLLMHYARENPVLAPLNHLIFGDVDGDARNDAVLTYQRTNGVGLDVEMIQRVVVFIYDHDEQNFVIRHDAEIGSSKSRILKPISIEGGLVTFAAIPCTGLEIRECNPPETIVTHFRWTYDGLVEM